MKDNSQTIYVFADWLGMTQPTLVGELLMQSIKGRWSSSFAFDASWIDRYESLTLDPNLLPFTGPQFPENGQNFGVFLDSMPDTWGRKLLQRKNAQQQENGLGKGRRLNEADLLLAVHDASRMGALRFKLDPKGPFLDNDASKSIPPISEVRTLQHAAAQLESEENPENKWLEMLLAPGSSLGGARPKANVRELDGSFWIAKFPAKNDTIDKGLWEYLAYKLATNCGVTMAPCRVEKITGNQHTFFTKRFDRSQGKRIHFSSAMAMLGYDESMLRDKTASYLEIAERVQLGKENAEVQLRELFKRIAFSISISNTDDHLRNHGFILHENEWMLSPAYDLNPSIDKTSLSLNIDTQSGELNFDLLLSTCSYYQLSEDEALKTIDQVQSQVVKWEEVAKELGISRSERELMRPAFSTF